ncbi:MAG: alpha-L-rhamnosidase N-terminal domain-containing protein [Mangrovibacterium sp.]
MKCNINNKKVGDHVLEPAQSTYSKRIYYSTYDVTDYLSEAGNVILVSVAPGWYGYPIITDAIGSYLSGWESEMDHIQ